MSVPDEQWASSYVFLANPTNAATPCFSGKIKNFRQELYL